MVSQLGSAIPPTTRGEFRGMAWPGLGVLEPGSVGSRRGKDKSRLRQRVGSCSGTEKTLESWRGPGVAEVLPGLREALGPPARQFPCVPMLDAIRVSLTRTTQ